ncbi:MAG TPA: universal stress protein [Eudoraea sp.]|nr:universal stress protein [Eudoraea sp.]
MKNILVATDFSHDAYCALFYAAKLFSSRPATFHILHVFDEYTPLDGKRTMMFGSKKRLKEIQIASEEQLTRTFHKIVLDSAHPQHRFRTISKKGILTKTVNKLIPEYDIDLVVMGVKGQTGAKEIFLGSNTMQVVNTVKHCPVLAVPRQIDFKTPKEIAFVTDFKKGCEKKTLAPLLFLASLHRATVHVMHITEEEILDKDQESYRKLLELSLKDVNQTFHRIHDFDDKARVIDTFLDKLHLDMFAMVYHKHSFFDRLMREPVIRDVSMYTETPFLILPCRD